MKTNIVIENVVNAENIVITTYPQWSDYGCLACATKVVVKTENGYKEDTYITEEIDGVGEAFELMIVWADYHDICVYHAYVKQQRITESQKSNNSFNAKIGDKVKVYKGRKNLGVEIVISGSYEFKDRYGRTQAYYWVSADGVRVNRENSVIVG